MADSTQSHNKRFSLGEGWHNAPPAHPPDACHDKRDGEFDPMYLTICLIEPVGLPCNVRHQPNGTRPSVPSCAFRHKLLTHGSGKQFLHIERLCVHIQ